MNDNKPTDAELNKFFHDIACPDDCYCEYLEEFVDKDMVMCDVCSVVDDSENCAYKITGYKAVPSYTTGGDEVRALIFSEIEKAGQLRLVISLILSRGDNTLTAKEVIIKATVTDILTAFKSVWEGRG